MYISVVTICISVCALVLMCCAIQMAGQMFFAWLLTSKHVIRRKTKNTLAVSEEMYNEEFDD